MSKLDKCFITIIIIIIIIITVHFNGKNTLFILQTHINKTISNVLIFGTIFMFRVNNFKNAC